jgi:hypothetical protein
VLNIQESVQEKVRTLCKRLDGELKENTVAPLHHMFNALSLDVASGYLFNHSFDSLHEKEYSIQFTVSCSLSFSRFLWTLTIRRRKWSRKF